MAELKPCPFCGSKTAEVVEDGNEYIFLRYFVACGRCGASTGRNRNKEKATEAWNRRADNESR